MKSTRREFLASVAGAAAFAGMTLTSAAGDLPRVTVHRSPTCGCCKAWAAHMRNAGFIVDVIDEADMPSVKARLRVPPRLVSCHTAEMGGYVLEGHVPAAAVRKLLDEKPNALGLAVADMPLGSPGMEGMGDPEIFDVVLFDASSQRDFARFKGDTQI